MFVELIKHDKRTDFEYIGRTENGKYSFRFGLCGHSVEYTSKQKTMRCLLCYDNIIRSKARVFGMSVVDSAEENNSRFKRFRYDRCGHEIIMQVHELTSRKRSKKECKECTKLGMESEAERAGMVMLRPSTEEDVGKKFINYKLYKFLSCGHEQHCQPTHVRRNNVKCTTCFHLSLRQDAARVGSEIVKDLGNAKYVIRLACGHEFPTFLQNIRKRTTSRCPLCYEVRIAEEAKEHGLELIGQTETVYGAYRKYKIVSCGHIIDTSPQCVKEDRFECKVCETSPYSSKSTVYLFKFSIGSFSWLKFGFSKNTEVRARGYGLPPETEHQLVFSMEVDNGRDAITIEKKIHRQMRDYRVDKEVMRRYHTNNGHSECYFSDSQNLFLDKLKDEKLKYEQEKTPSTKTT